MVSPAMLTEKVSGVGAASFAAGVRSARSTASIRSLRGASVDSRGSFSRQSAMALARPVACSTSRP